MCDIKLIPVSLKQSGSRFYIEAEMLLVFHHVDNNASHMFTPVLSDSNHRIELPLILVAGKNRYRAFRQVVWRLGHNLLRGYKIRKIFKAVNHSLVSYSYRVYLDYEEWMPKAEISLSKNN